MTDFCAGESRIRSFSLLLCAPGFLPSGVPRSDFSALTMNHVLIYSLILRAMCAVPATET